MDSSIGRKRKLSQQQEVAAAKAKGLEEEDESDEEAEDVGDAKPAKQGMRTGACASGQLLADGCRRERCNNLVPSPSPKPGVSRACACH